MLDDLKYIAQIDTSDILGIAARQADQFDWEFDFTAGSEHSIKNVVLGGMGGSSWPSELLPVWPGLSVPFEVVRTYSLPNYVGSDTLFIASSFSGNTEETLSMLADAKKRNAQIVVIAAGGKLEGIAKQENYPFVKIDHSIPQPRMSTYNQIKGLVTILSSYGLCDVGELTKLSETKSMLAKAAQDWKAEIPTKDNLAKQMAEFMAGKSPVIYSGPKLYPAAKKLKIAINENAKNVAWLNTYPEYNHNEFIGWTIGPVQKPYAVINLLSELEHPRVAKRFEISDRLLSGKRPEPMNIHCQGETVLQQVFWAFMLSDFAATYLAILNGVDPEPVALVEKFKGELDK